MTGGSLRRYLRQVAMPPGGHVKPQSQPQQRSGFAYGLAAYSMWGLVPLYWPLLEPAGAVEILAHRMVWSLVAVGLVLLALRRWSWIRPLLREPRRLGM